MYKLTLFYNVDRVIEDDLDLVRRDIADQLTSVADYIRNNGINWKAGAIRDNDGQQTGVWQLTNA